MRHLTTTTAIAALVMAAFSLPAAANNHADMKKAKMSKVEFSDIDVNADGRIDFTEYSNYAETKMGMTAADSAVEYVKFADEAGIITEASFEMMQSGDHKNHMKKSTKTMTTSDGMTTTTRTETRTDSVSMTSTPGTREMTTSDIKMMNDTVLRPGQTVTMTETMSRPSGTVTSDSMTTTTIRTDANRMADYGLFVDYDTNSDGRVSFAEYSKYRRKSGVTSTQAAQEFIRMSNGAATFDEMRFNTSMSADVLERPSYKSMMPRTSNP